MNVYCSSCDTFGATFEREAKCGTCYADMSYKCELCNEFSPSYSDLQSHVLNVHIMNTEMSIENKDETSENLEGKADCDEINYSCDSNAQLDNDKQPLDEDKGNSSNNDSPTEQEAESSVIENSVVEQTDFDKFVESITNKCEGGLNGLLLPKRKKQTNGIKRYCLRCDKIKKDLDIIRIGSKKEICEKCRSDVLYQCVKCKRKSTVYSVMMYHWKNYCVFLRPKHSAVKLNTPEKYNSSNTYNRIERHQCRLCPYSSNLKNRLMLHLQMHSWKDIKRAVLEPENHSDTSISSK